MSGTNFRDRESSRLFLDYARGVDTFVSKLYSPRGMKIGLEKIAKRNKALAFTPEIRQRFMSNLENMYQSDYGPQSSGSIYSFQMPNFSAMEDKAVIEFYGIEAIPEQQTQVETDEERLQRLTSLAADMTVSDLSGLAQMSQWYDIEEWGRYPLLQMYDFGNVDLQLFRNPDKMHWCTGDRGISSYDKSTQLINPHYASIESIDEPLPQRVYSEAGAPSWYTDNSATPEEIMDYWF